MTRPTRTTRPRLVSDAHQPWPKKPASTTDDERRERAYRAAQSEQQFQAQVIDLAQRLGYACVYHTWLSIHSAGGFPDLVIAGRGRVIFAEVKTDIGAVTPAQQRWLTTLGACAGVEVYVWRPRDLEAIGAILHQEGRGL